MLNFKIKMLEKVEKVLPLSCRGGKASKGRSAEAPSKYIIFMIVYTIL